MADKSNTTQTSTTVSKSGMIPRPNYMPQAAREPRLRLEIPPNHHEGAATSTMPIVTEGKDISALGDDDTDTVTVPDNAQSGHA